MGEVWGCGEHGAARNAGCGPCATAENLSRTPVCVTCTRLRTLLREVGEAMTLARCQLAPTATAREALRQALKRIDAELGNGATPKGDADGRA